MMGFTSLVLLVILAIAVIGGWVGLAIALVLLATGILGGARYIERITWTRDSPDLLRGGPWSMHEDLSITQDTPALEPWDLPQGSPTRHELAARRRARPRRRPPTRGDVQRMRGDGDADRGGISSPRQRQATR
ncbi:MAG TPA: hypothetical protein VMU32_01410 [Solirubrobacteraceae bacterium]|nr:hypothetical protein [Solirubrobacteraceae bacterium]